MSGHSKWATIKHRKGANDVKRGKLFSKLVREITVAAKMGGDVNANPRLRLAVNNAKNASMPGKNIENAIKKGSGNKETNDFFEVIYEGYGPGGVAILVECLTDNKNRTVAAVRSTFTKLGGSMGESGSVAWQFEKKGVINIERDQKEEEELLEVAIECGAEDMLTETDGYTIYTSMENFHQVYEKLKETGLEFANAELSMVPKNTIEINSEDQEKLDKLLEHLDDLDDVNSVASNDQRL